MYNYLVAFYNYILSFFYPLPSPVAPVPSSEPAETWEDIYESIESHLDGFAVKLHGLDELFYASSSSKALEKMFEDILLDFRSIQKMVFRLKNMSVIDDAQRLIRDQNVKDIAKYLQQESETVRQLQNSYLMKSEQDRELNDQINEVDQETLRQEELMAEQKETQMEQFNYSL